MAKETLKIVIAGHVDHGKSTLIGRLLLDTHSLPKGKLEEVRKISTELGKDTELAYLTDQLKEEREQNRTIDTAQTFFETGKRNYVIIDAPGHVEFIKNMITGASMAEAAILIIDTQEGIMEQTKRHTCLLKMLGLRQIIVAFNKMDLINYNEKTFHNLAGKFSGFTEKLGFPPSCIIPISAKTDDNISRRSHHLSWFHGPHLITALDRLKRKEKPESSALRFSAQDVYSIAGAKIIAGKVLSGEIRKGQPVTILPSMKKTKVTGIKVFGRDFSKAFPGESIGLTIDRPDEIKRGELICSPDDLPKITDRFHANLFWLAPQPLRTSEPFMLRCNTQEMPCCVESIEEKIDSSSLNPIAENENELGTNEIAVVTIKTENPLVLESVSRTEELGRFVIEQQYATRGLGILSD